MVCNRVEEDEEREGTSLDININMNTMNVQNENLECALHTMIMPFSMQSHVNYLMNLAVMPRFFITFVNTEWIHKFMVEVYARNANSHISLVSRDNHDHQSRKNIFLSIPNGFP
jgi:hypothetical protein